MTWSSWLGKLGKDIDEAFSSADKATKKTITMVDVVQQLNATTEALDKVIKAHNKLRTEFDALSSSKEEELQKLKAENRRLVGAHNDVVRELGATKKDLKGDIARLERRIASILDPVGEAESFIDSNSRTGSSLPGTDEEE